MGYCSIYIYMYMYIYIYIYLYLYPFLYCDATFPRLSLCYSLYPTTNPSPLPSALCGPRHRATLMFLTHKPIILVFTPHVHPCVPSLSACYANIIR